MYSIILRTGYDAVTGWVAESSSLEVEIKDNLVPTNGQAGDIVVNWGIKDRAAAEEILQNYIHKEHSIRGISISYEEILGSKLYVCRIAGKIVGASENPCLICKHYRGCDYDNGSCDILS